MNCAFYRDAALDAAPAVKGLDWVPEYMCGNVWPDEDGDDDAGDGLPALQGFRVLMQEMCCFIIDVAALVARSVDRYAEERVDGYTAPRKDDGGVGYLESVVRGSYTTKARLLHYFPPEATAKERARSSSSSSAAATEEEGGKEGQKEEEEEDVDSWCATHLDHGCLTGLLSALYLDSTTPLPALPELPTPIPAPDPTAGLYIYSRSGTAVKVNIPPDCIAFQTGEALQKITDGKFRAVPHYVSPGTGIGTGTGTGTKNETGIEAGTGDASAKGRRGAGLMRGVERNTLAVFTQPNLQDVVDRRTGQVFGGFAAEVVSRNTVMG